MNIDDEIKKIKTIQENLNNVNGTHSYTFKEIFNDEFVSTHTKFSNISDFLKPSGLDFNSQESFQNIDVSVLDDYISKNSDFSSWEEMKSTAGKLLLSRKIGL